MKLPILAANYEATAQTLVARIEALVSTNPEILTMESAWDLFSIPAFSVGDLNPSYAQASAALSLIQRRHADNHAHDFSKPNKGG
jgi:hypothetical protein